MKNGDSAKTGSQNDVEEILTNFSNNKNTTILQTASAVLNLNSFEQKTLIYYQIMTLP